MQISFHGFPHKNDKYFWQHQREVQFLACFNSTFFFNGKENFHIFLHLNKYLLSGTKKKENLSRVLSLFAIYATLNKFSMVLKTTKKFP
jgi:hypothetical protein